jgi:hypothetical protein
MKLVVFALRLALSPATMAKYNDNDNANASPSLYARSLCVMCVRAVTGDRFGVRTNATNWFN